MKKAFFVPTIFFVSLLIASFFVACIFAFSTLSFERFWSSVFEFFPLSVLIATILTFSYVLKTDANTIVSGILLTIILLTCIFIFYIIFSKSTSKNFILQDFKFTNVRGESIFLQNFFDKINIFFTDAIILSQTNFKIFLLFLTSFSLAIISYFFLALKFTSWKLINLILMLCLIFASLYFYPFLSSFKFKVIFMSKDSVMGSIFSVPIIFYSISIFVFLLSLFIFLIKKYNEKKRNKF